MLPRFFKIIPKKLPQQLPKLGASAGVLAGLGLGMQEYIFNYATYYNQIDVMDSKGRISAPVRPTKYDVILPVVVFGIFGFGGGRIGGKLLSNKLMHSSIDKEIISKIANRK